MTELDPANEIDISKEAALEAATIYIADMVVLAETEAKDIASCAAGELLSARCAAIS